LIKKKIFNLSATLTVQNNIECTFYKYIKLPPRLTYNNQNNAAILSQGEKMKLKLAFLGLF